MPCACSAFSASGTTGAVVASQIQTQINSISSCDDPPKTRSSSDFTVDDADPIISKHAIHWIVCTESYKTIKTPIQCKWELIHSETETCAYKKKDEDRVIIGFRGTSDTKDLYDDMLIVQQKVYPRVLEAIELIKTQPKFRNMRLEVTGHSLGGAIARDVGKSLRLPSITFNAAAPPSYPVTSDGVDYHIIPDIISAWQSPNTIRIDKGFRPSQPLPIMLSAFASARETFNEVIPSHSLKNFAKSPPGKIVTTEFENRIIQGWFMSLPLKSRNYLLVAMFGINGMFNTSLPQLK